MKLIGITGGSGVGKSTLCYSLMDANPQMISVLHLDDYQKLKTEKNLPMHKGKVNWDHPNIIDWDKLHRDIQQLQSGHSITLKSWSHRDNPDYHNHRNMMDILIDARPIILLEGYLSLYKNIFDILDYTIFLDLDYETRIKRRKKFMNPVYEQEVLIPMHQQFVEPTKTNADIVLDVSDTNQNDVYIFMRDSINETLNINLK